MPLRILIRRWVTHNRRVYSHHTHLVYARALWRFADSIPTDYENLTPEHIEAFIEKLSQRYKRNTVNSTLGAIMSFCRWASENYELHNPAKYVKCLKPELPNQRVLSDQEYKKVLSVCSDGQADVIKLLAHTGLRSSEFTLLDWPNVAPDLKFLTIIGKGQKRRIVPLSQTATAIIRKYKNLNPTSFNLSKSFNRPCALLRFCQRLAKRAGIPSFGPHALRHYFATALMRKNVPLAKIAKIMGHSSPDFTLKLYIHFASQDIIGVTDCLDEK